MMRKFATITTSLAFCIALFAQEKMYIHKTDKNTFGALISAVDSVKFNDDASVLYFNIGNTVAQYLVSDIDSLSFGSNSNVISIAYNGNSASVNNPFAFEGVSVDINGADVTVYSTNASNEIQYKLSGTTGEGQFKIYSEKAFSLSLNGANITNSNGPAINIQSKKAVGIILENGTTNILTDGATYATAVVSGGFAEDQGATFFSEGQLLFSGTGNLTINGKGTDKHALCSDDYIQVDNGNITITSAQKDGIHTKDGYIMNGGNVTITSSGDGIDGDVGFVNILGGSSTITCASADANGICCDSTITVSGGTINIAITGSQSKGIKSGKSMTLSGGDITINAAGGIVLTALGAGLDPSYCTAIKSTVDVTVNGASITINHTGEGGKGISTGTTFTMTSGTVNITTSGEGAIYTDNLGTMNAYSACGISTNGTLSILGGTTTITSTGIGGKGLSADGILTFGSTTGAPVINVSTSGASVMYTTNSITEPKAVKSDKDIYLINGTIAINAAGTGEAIDTKGSIFMSGGTVIVQGPPSGSLTKSIDYENAFNITGGLLIESGPYRSKIPTPTTNTSTQNFVYATLSTTTTTLAANTLFNIQDAGNNSLITFKPARDAYFFIFSSPSLQKSTSYSIYTGGSSTGTNINGLYKDGSYSGGTKKTTFTSSITTKTSTTFAK